MGSISFACHQPPPSPPPATLEGTILSSHSVVAAIVRRKSHLAMQGRVHYLVGSLFPVGHWVTPPISSLPPHFEHPFLKLQNKPDACSANVREAPLNKKRVYLGIAQIAI